MTDAGTMEEIYLAGLAALKRELGTAGMVRFLQFIDRGSGDYTRDRHTWLDHLTVDDIAAEIERRRAETSHPGE